jgi:uncharacterized protein involved in exopolysaccharide biosynthesis
MNELRSTTLLDGMNAESTSDSNAGAGRSGGIVALLIVLGRYKLPVAATSAVVALAATVIVFVMPVTYTATARILPPQQGQSMAAAMLGQLGGGLAGMAGGVLGVRSANELYVGMLKSATVADGVIARFQLKDVFRERYQVDARKILAKASRFSVDKSGIIVIEADAATPELAAGIANAYIDELHQVMNTLAISDAAQRRVFFEKEVEGARARLADSEARLRNAITDTGLVSVEAQSRGAVDLMMRLRAQISAKEIEIGAMTYATANNPERIRVEQQLATMRQELARLELGRRGSAKSNTGEHDGAATGVANIQLLRDVKYNETVFEFLAKQLELARVEESKQAPIVQVLDRAPLPEKRSKPKRALIVAGAFVVGLLLAAGGACLVDALQRNLTDPSRRAQIEDLRRAWRGKTRTITE